MTPTARSLKHLRSLGWTAAIVERWNPYAKVRQDLFGIIDIVALRPRICLGVQTTIGAHHADRIAKAMAEPRLLPWLLAGCRFQVWSWAQRGPRGKRKLWTLRIEEIVADVEPTGMIKLRATEAPDGDSVMPSEPFAV